MTEQKALKMADRIEKLSKKYSELDATPIITHCNKKSDYMKAIVGIMMQIPVICVHDCLDNQDCTVKTRVAMHADMHFTATKAKKDALIGIGFNREMVFWRYEIKTTARLDIALVPKRKSYKEYVSPHDV